MAADSSRSRTCSPGNYDITAELAGLQEDRAPERAARRRGVTLIGSGVGDRQHYRAGHGDGGVAAAADRRRRAQDRRSERHRAAVVPGSQSDWRRRAEGRCQRRQLQHARLRRPRQRRLQHQRQPQRREQHHHRRCDGDPHAIVRAPSSAFRTSTPYRKCRY